MSKKKDGCLSGCFSKLGVIFLILLALGIIIKLVEKGSQKSPPVSSVNAPSIPPPKSEVTKEPEKPKTSADYLKDAKNQLAMKSPDQPYGDIYHAAYLLSYIPKDASEYPEAQRLLKEIEKLKEKDLASMRQKAAQEKKALRQLYGPGLETQFLEKGYDVSVKVTGKDATILHLSCIIFSRPFMYNLTKDGVLINIWRDMGFKKVVVSNGYRVTCFMDL